MNKLYLVIYILILFNCCNANIPTENRIRIQVNNFNKLNSNDFKELLIKTH